jgi:hypothetical protein
MRRRLPSLLALIVLCSSCARSEVKHLATAGAAAEAFSVPIIQLRGSPADIGAAHARQLAEPIRDLFGAYFGKYFANALQRNMAMMAATAFEGKLLPEHRAEVAALARDVGLDERQVMLGQCFLDLSEMTACSTIALPASAASDHVARFGRNLDFPSFNVADKSTVLMIVHPNDHYAFASIAWPGMVGVLSGMNEHGLALANMEVDRGRRMPTAMPYALLYRTVLERCKTVDDAIALLQSTPRQTANNLMLMDAAGNRAVVEITPETLAVRRGDDSAALISTNHQRGADADTSGRCDRYDYLHDVAAKRSGKIDVGGVEDMLGHVVQGRMTLQSMVFEPANRVIYLATGENAPTRGYHRLDLTRYFK